MKALTAVALAGLTVIGSVAPGFAQYGRPDVYDGPRGGYDRPYRDDYRDREYRPDRDYGRGRDYGPRGGGYAFDEREYLRCNPDVRRAVASGQMASGAAHYQTYGRREGRRLSC